MNTSCQVCHSGMGGSVYTGTSTMDAYGISPGYGCSGCHGQVIGSRPRSNGLRIFHRSNGYAGCGGGPCHMLPEYAEPEDIKPPNYGGTLTNVDDSCNYGPDYLEDWSGDEEGLDNDGDLILDSADPDCLATPTPTASGITPTPTIGLNATSRQTASVLMVVISVYLFLFGLRNVIR